MSNLSLNAKVVIVMSIFVISNIVAVVMGLNRLSNANTTMSTLVDSYYQRINKLNHLKYQQTVLGVQLRESVLESDEAGVKKLMDVMATNRTALEKEADEFFAIAAQQGKDAITKYKAQFNDWYTAANVVTKQTLETKNKDQGFADIKKKTSPLRAEMVKTLEAIIELNEKRMDDAILTAHSDYTESRNFLIVISLASLLLGSVFAFFTMRAANRQIRQVIDSLNASSGEMASATQQIAATSHQLSESSTEQAASLQETAASMEEMSSMVKVNAENATQAAKLSQDGRQDAVKGEREIQMLTERMDKIQNSSKKVEEVISVIDDIAFQTNLLALNAAVEAARAGEEGKGFAVVAEAVRSLAMKSAESAKIVSDLIKATVDDVKDGVQATNSSSALLSALAEAIKKISSLNQEISTASSEQANGLAQINLAMNQMDAMTQRNAAASEEAASMSQELSSQADALRQAVVQLVTVIDGKKHQPPQAS